MLERIGQWAYAHWLFLCKPPKDYWDWVEQLTIENLFDSYNSHVKPESFFQDLGTKKYVNDIGKSEFTKSKEAPGEDIIV